MTCEYCGSRCTDVRGNCGACGAPKEHKDILTCHDDLPEFRPWYMRISHWNINPPQITIEPHTGTSIGGLKIT